MPTYKINITLARELSIAAQSHRRSPTKELEDILETFFKANAVTKVAPKSPYANAATHTNEASEASKPSSGGRAYDATCVSNIPCQRLCA